MGIIEIIVIAIGLAMDAFAVAVSKGISIKNINIKTVLIISIYFGSFQALMPIIGYILGVNFEAYVIQIDHWIAFILLSYIGISMIKEAFSKEDNDNPDLRLKTMLTLAIATSIDALAIGITFAFLKVDIVSSSAIIGIITFIISSLGVIIGNKFRGTYGKKAELLGGLILILIGVKILLEHLNIIH